MRKLTKKLFAAFATHTNSVDKSTFTMQINVYDSNFTNWKPLLHTMRCNKDNNSQTCGKTNSLTKAFSTVSISSLVLFHPWYLWWKYLTQLWSDEVLLLLKLLNISQANPHRYLCLSWVMLVPSLH